MLFSVAEKQGFPLYRKFLNCRVRTSDRSFHNLFRIFLRCLSVSAYSSMALATVVFLLPLCQQSLNELGIDILLLLL
jgi:hypothetical protein